jgi:peptidoglycan L-alanyl-D-glutamate endopeptidase CwlK
MANDPWMIANGIEPLIYCTLRDGEAQEAEYARGRTTPGLRVTWARAGESLHQYGLAFDFVPLRHGKPVWGTGGNGLDDDQADDLTDDDLTDDLELWMRCGAIGELVGLAWAGRWAPPKREFPHMQYTGGLTLADLQAGQLPADPVNGGAA